MFWEAGHEGKTRIELWGSRQSFATPHSRVPSAMIGQYTLKPDTHSNRDTREWIGKRESQYYIYNGMQLYSSVASRAKIINQVRLQVQVVTSERSATKRSMPGQNSDQ